MNAPDKRLSLAADISGLVSAIFALIFICININNWANIARGTAQSGGISSSVGVDAPVIYPIVVCLVGLLIGIFINRKELSKLRIISITILVCVIAIWFFGLGFENKNPYQSLVM